MYECMYVCVYVFMFEIGLQLKYATFTYCTCALRKVRTGWGNNYCLATARQQKTVYKQLSDALIGK